MIDPKFIGKTYEPVKYTVGVEKIKEYALAVGETNPLYLDEEKAAAGPYGCVVAPPVFAVVYSKELVSSHIFDTEIDLNLAMLVHGEQEFEFHQVVRAGDVVITDGKIVDVQNKEKLDVITLKTYSRVEGELATTGRYTFVVRR